MTNEHLSPEVFVDVLEGSPVDASWHQHLSTCSQCREELRGLEQTLALVSVDANAPPVAVSMSMRPMQPTRVVPAWAAAVGAALLAAVGVYGFFATRDTSPASSAEMEELLPPVDEDQEFQLLLALSDATDAELVEIAVPSFDGFALDPARLTPGERQRFVERLTEEMRSSL